MSRKLLHRVLFSTWFSAIVLAILISILAAVAYSVTKSYHVEPDFGGMVTIRQSEVDPDSVSSDHIQLTPGMILKYITAEENLLPVAAKYGWDVPYKKMVQQIDVRQKITAKNCFVISVNTGNMKRSSKVAEALVTNFIESYRKKWETMNRKNLILCQKQICAYEQEIKELLKAKRDLRGAVTMNPIKSDIEMSAINEQLVSAQQQFFTSYCEYVGKLSDKYTDTEIELNVALRSSTEQDPKVKALRSSLSVMKESLDRFQQELASQNPDVYSMKIQPEKLKNVPPHIAFLYDNIQRLQQIKLTLLLPSIIQEKQQRLEAEQRKRMTLEHLLNSRSCDVFIREIGR